MFNVDDAELADDALRDRLAKLVAPAESVFLDAKTEAELADLPTGRSAELLAELGLGEPGPEPAGQGRLRGARACHLPDCRPEGSAGLDDQGGATAPEAAGVIHTDFQKGFIKAEIVSYDDLIAAGSSPPPDPRARPGSRARTTSCATAT